MMLMLYDPAPEARKDVILVVSHERFCAEYVASALLGAGYGVVIASDVEEGWELFQRERSWVRVVVIDLLLPGTCHGLDLARRVRGVAPGTSVLLLTAHRPPKPLGPGCAMLPKPFRAEALCFAVRQLVRPGCNLVAATLSGLDQLR